MHSFCNSLHLDTDKFGLTGKTVGNAEERVALRLDRCAPMWLGVCERRIDAFKFVSGHRAPMLDPAQLVGVHLDRRFTRDLGIAPSASFLRLLLGVESEAGKHGHLLPPKQRGDAKRAGRLRYVDACTCTRSG